MTEVLSSILIVLLFVRLPPSDRVEPEPVKKFKLPLLTKDPLVKFKFALLLFTVVVKFIVPEFVKLSAAVNVDDNPDIP